jgi:hypothetical protein
MEFKEGQLVRVKRGAEAPDYAKGRLAVISEVMRKQQGTVYTCSLFSLRFPICESDLDVGPDKIVH